MNPSQLEDLLSAQREACLRNPVPSFNERRRTLLALRALISDHRDELCAAISADYGHRSQHETRFAEILPVLRAIDHNLSRLRAWMRPRRAPIDRVAFGLAGNRVLAHPLGVVGVIVPWNFPLHLSCMPLVSILAAGNRALVKTSERSVNFGRLMARLVGQAFEAEQLVFIEDPGGLGPRFSSMRFDHLVFTGSSPTGVQVMKAAAAHLCPVTLELGGRSPAVIYPDFDVKPAADRILYSKCLNAGQICASVDHVYVPRARVMSFVERAKNMVARWYPSLASEDYTSIIDSSAYLRLTELLDQAQSVGAELVSLMPGPSRDPVSHRLAPHLVIDPPPDAAILADEIFGPILPVLPYDDVETVIQTIQRQPRPLAFYPFTHDRHALAGALQRVQCGGVSVNDTIFHVTQDGLPFGGIGESGMGHYHGRAGFDNFSKAKPVFLQSRFPVTGLIRPPYGSRVEAILRWFRS